MDFGIALQWGDFRHMGLSPTLIEIAKSADELGFQSLWTTDQMTARSDPAFATEPLVTIASLMHVVPKMQLGVSVLVLPQRNAVVVAKQAATLSLLSNGRFILGVGVGWNADEYKLLNADYTKRGRKMDESIEVMKRLWREDCTSFEGKFYAFKDVTMTPKPPASHVPLWIGGNSTAAIQRAAHIGDAWMPAMVSPQALHEGVKQLEELLGNRKQPTVAAMLTIRIQTSDDDNGTSSAPVAGSIQSIISTLQAYEHAGLDHLICTFAVNNIGDLSRQMRDFSKKIMPHFKNN
jgi:probable F420-dependent oxidoreductase